MNTRDLQGYKKIVQDLVTDIEKGLSHTGTQDTHQRILDGQGIPDSASQWVNRGKIWWVNLNQ